jgi:FKBP-type peptidyl-prolyl cis-trans isomerase
VTRPIAAISLSVLVACSPKATSVSPSETPSAAPPTAEASPIPTPPADAIRTASGVLYVREGGTEGAVADADDECIATYRVHTSDGELVASSAQGQPARLDMKLLPPGWAEAMTHLHAGDRAKIWVPAALGHAETDTGPVGALYIEVELHEIVARSVIDPKTLPIAAPPDDAIRTPSGLAYVYLHRGSGTVRPTTSSKVSAHYTGWTTDGKKFDSSRDRGEPLDFSPSQVIKGWTEALQLMVVGDEIRVWIPVELAYQNKPGRPAGMLIFDIELLAVE